MVKILGGRFGGQEEDLCGEAIRQQGEQTRQPSRGWLSGQEIWSFTSVRIKWLRRLNMKY